MDGMGWMDKGYFCDFYMLEKCCLLPVFGVRVSVMFHLTCAHIIFSSVSVPEWPPFGK